MINTLYYSLGPYWLGWAGLVLAVYYFFIKGFLLVGWLVCSGVLTPVYVIITACCHSFSASYATRYKKEKKLVY